MFRLRRREEAHNDQGAWLSVVSSPSGVLFISYF